MSFIEALGYAAPVIGLAGALIGFKLGRSPNPGNRLRKP